METIWYFRMKIQPNNKKNIWIFYIFLFDYYGFATNRSTSCIYHEKSIWEVVSIRIFASCSGFLLACVWLPHTNQAQLCFTSLFTKSDMKHQRLCHLMLFLSDRKASSSCESSCNSNDIHANSSSRCSQLVVASSSCSSTVDFQSSLEQWHLQHSHYFWVK